MSAPFTFAIERISSDYDCSSFDCDGSSTIINHHLQSVALDLDVTDRERTFLLIATDENSNTEQVAGYYTLTASLMPTLDIPSGILPDSKLPHDLPVIYLDFIARDKNFRGYGLGRRLLVDALRCSLIASEHIGAVGLFLIAISKEMYQLASNFSFTDFDAGFNGYNRMFLPMSEACSIFDEADA